MEKLRQDIIVPILEDLKIKRELAAVAKRLKTDRSRLTEIKNGTRILTFFWLNMFINGGIMGIEHILRGRKLEELEDIELDTVLRLDADRETLQLIYEAKRDGLDIKTLLKTLLKKS